ncbi:hypothetical protein ASG56_15115 [Rhodococcus sp. Leaf7]|uniref:hypothetical protein n=1 Tax=unclassified Rhodococcus (in: high G+C Gram-positive bacteria) TaxID=192944 RepID=UPI0006F957AA|nr:MULTISPECIES: hypothetical protein [unclassified Rhodococcus (in: high G+C Gram-positive bacteria)]KQU04637.1 hypothetical protein ASG56_15115 [Rhodococcus sp. Leaf7]KQU40822.1 hypothetical protein ASG64_15105 [Rhodococcus sp. Leaf247]
MSTGRGSGFRGGAVGALTAALAVAAHGAGGGEIPGSDSLTFLVVASLGVGVLAGSVGTGRSGRLALLPWLAGGQVVAHQALALAADHSHPVGPSMLTAHAVAVGVCALLLGAAERLLRAITSVLRTPTRSFTPLPRRATISATAPLGMPTPVPALTAVSRRGPPSVSTP